MTDIQFLLFLPEFTALMEGKNYPIWASQFHPEKNPYEWTRHYTEIPHSKHAMISSAYFADFFVEQARQNYRKFESRSLEGLLREVQGVQGRAGRKARRSSQR